jgi:hypothetical protein
LNFDILFIELAGKSGKRRRWVIKEGVNVERNRRFEGLK